MTLRDWFEEAIAAACIIGFGAMITVWDIVLTGGQ